MKFSDLFSVRLYKEGLNRVKGIGIVAVIWALIASLGSPLALFAVRLMTGSLNAGNPTTVMPGELVGHMTILLLFAPLIVGRSFRFLNKRNTCDFYHALPYRRITVYSSFFLGALTWVMAAAIVPFLLALLLYAVFPFSAVMIGPSLLALLAFVVCLLFLCGASALAMTMTGTAFSNFAVFCILVLEIPTLMAIFTLALQAVVPVFDASKTVLAYLTYAKSLPIMILRSGNRVVAYDGWAVAIYGVVGVAFIVLGGLAYIRRPGEMAGTAARPAWQSVWRNCISAPVMFLGMTALLKVFMPGSFNENRGFFAVSAAAAVGFALGAAILYELLSTGNMRSIGRVIRHYLWLFAASAVFVAAALGFRGGVLAKKTDKEKIVSVSFSQNDSSLMDYFNTPTYEDLATKNIGYTDREIIDILYNCYTESIDACRRGEFETYGAVSAGNGYLQNDYYQGIYVTFRTSHGSFTRLLRIPTSRYETLLEKKYDTDTYVKASVTMPSRASVSLLTLTYTDNAADIWKIFCEEYEALSEAEKIAYKLDTRAQNGEWVFYFQVDGVYGGEYYISYYPVPVTFEKTVNALAAEANKATKKKESSLIFTRDALARALENGSANMDLTAILYDANGKEAASAFISYGESHRLNEEEKRTLSGIIDAIDAMGDAEYTAGTPFLVIDISADDSELRYCIVLLSEDTYASLLSAMNSDPSSAV